MILKSKLTTKTILNQALLLLAATLVMRVWGTLFSWPNPRVSFLASGLAGAISGCSLQNRSCSCWDQLSLGIPGPPMSDGPQLRPHSSVADWKRRERLTPVSIHKSQFQPSYALVTNQIYNSSDMLYPWKTSVSRSS